VYRVGVVEDELMEIFTLPTMSHDAERLVELHARWIELRQARGHSMPEGAFARRRGTWPRR
jgi:hypothetical protein